ncbi:uncharacterized protein MONBRDRAFT_26063 [Monosiga brevicollis MX1]|uniref:Glycosyl hydrolase family 43 protein n=1 Tax=Monosiga brevicollis TaxID=81824 RepID=A9V195_MONBE|nr:uncharacterized protein MONBRDRAFT_26063 [Monosiga brevicollis MX1]EDQ88893.1 predicted protein [Monosiga brevicollis MX1]|eukprot:XP_001746506.1 hypothetical protein [Monosiga brevicollis MX1]
MVGARGQPLCGLACVLVTLVWVQMIGSMGGAAIGANALRAVNVSNTALPRDQLGQRLLTGEADVLEHEGTYYFYFNNWGGCPGVDCCATGNCATCCFTARPYTDPCVYTANHTVVVYATQDFANFTYLGVALPTSARPEPRIEFRPHVVYNARDARFVMWYESRIIGGASMYAVAVSETPQGPFTTLTENVAMAGSGRIGDYDIFVDDDGIAYHVRTGFVVEQLTANYTASTGNFTTFSTPQAAEAPIMFKRQGTYYMIAGTGCCACRGGSTIYLFAASHPLSTYTYLGDFGSNTTHAFDPASPWNYVTRSQPTAVFRVPSPTRAASMGSETLSHDDQYIFLGNQWVTAAEPGHPRNHDLLYWSQLSFTANNSIEHLQWQDAATIHLP